ncbi:MAG: rhodanese-like domain-containing protein [Chloroflexota bacterium]|nr:rhodanese-like domain-containing protein [Chloroflexota bacterium]
MSRSGDVEVEPLERKRVVPTQIDRDEVRRLVEAGGQLVEVLPPKEYEEEHLPGAVSIPLKKLDRQSTAQLKQEAPVIVYCHDSQ